MQTEYELFTQTSGFIIKMIDVTSLNEIKEIIYNRSIKNGLIAIDGASSSGKSQTTDELGECNNAITIHIDNYLNNNGETYIDRVQYDRLNKLISNNVEKLIFVEGICLIPIIEALNLNVTLYIYVARVSGNTGQLCDQELFDNEFLAKKTPENFFDEAPFSNYRHTQEWIDQQVRIYQKKYNPLLRTDILFKKKEQNK